MAVKANFNIDQGDTFSVLFELTDDNGVPLDLSFFTVESEFKKTYSSVNSYSFDCAIVAASNGVFSIGLTADESSIVCPGRYVYDIKVTDPSGNVLRVLEGLVTITPEVSQ